MQETNTQLYRRLTAAMATNDHRDLTGLTNLFSAALQANPAFAGRFVMRLAQGATAINDQKLAALIAGLSGKDPFIREASQAILLGSDAYTVVQNGAEIEQDSFDPRSILRVIKALADNKQARRRTRVLVFDFLRMLETNPARLDGAVIHNRKALKTLMTRHRVPGREFPRLNAILFQNKMPAGSKLAALRAVANEPDPQKRVLMALETKLPFRVLVSVLPKLDASTGVALVQAMSPAEALNSRGWLERSGLLNIPEVKALVLSKIEKATKSASSALKRKSAAGTDADMQAAVEKAANTAAKQVLIKHDVAVMVDLSQSMDAARQVAAEVLARLLAASEGDVRAYQFGETSQAARINFRGTKLTDLLAEFGRLRAGGWTDMLSGWQVMRRDRFAPGTVVWITDGGENKPHRDSMAEELSRSDLQPQMVVVGMGSYDSHFADGLERTGAPTTEFVLHGTDYTLLDNVVRAVAGSSGQSMVDEIALYDLPRITARRFKAPK